MPIDPELMDAVHLAVVKSLQPLPLETQLLSLLTELSEQDVTADRRIQRIGILQSEVDTTKIGAGGRIGN